MVKYLATNKIDTPTEHIIRSYGMWWRIETFSERLGDGSLESIITSSEGSRQR